MSHTDKQLQILQAAEKLFAEKGFDGTSVRDIATEADVNLAMISYYFKSKENLMQAIFEERMDQTRIRIENLVLDTSLEPMAKLEMLVDEYIDRIMAKQAFHKIVVCEQVINKNPVILRLVNDLKRKNRESVQKLIRDGQNRGVFRKEVDLTLMLSVLFGTVSQMLVNKDYYREAQHLESLSDQEFDLYLRKQLSKHLKMIFKAILTHEP
jgi:AcrR family transcriptional regulator